MRASLSLFTGLWGSYERRAVEKEKSEIMPGQLELLGIGLLNALSPMNMAMILSGLVIGVLAGALPGITMLNAVVLVLPSPI